MQAQLEKINSFYRAKELQLEVVKTRSYDAACRHRNYIMAGSISDPACLYRRS